MRTYVMLMKADRLSGLGLLASGESGATNQEQVVKRLEGSVVKQLAVNGEYDVVLICEFPSSEAALAFGLLQTAAGFYTTALEAFTPAQVDVARQLVEKAAPSL